MKPLILIIVLLVGLGYGVAVGNISIQQPKELCLYHKKFLPAGEQQTIMTMGSLTFKYQPYKWDCEPDEHYNPAQYRVEEGALVPLATPAAK